MPAIIPWHIGNTTVRRPYRLRDGLRSLANSPLVGNLVGRDKESAFARLLHEKEIVFVQRIANDQSGDFSDVGRKWRVALSQLGFITPKLTRGEFDPSGGDPLLQPIVRDCPSLSGRPFEITPNGYRLIDAESLPAQQECFLRSLVAYQLPSVLETSHDCAPFSPLRIVLKTFKRLEQSALNPEISFEEMASVVQLSKDEANLDGKVALIDRYRQERNRASNKDRFDAAFRQNQSGYTNAAKLRTLADYADLNFRYLKATGLFSAKGRGIIRAKEKTRLIDQLLAEDFTPRDNGTYLKTLWNGATLPTDREDEAAEVIRSLVDLLRSKGETVRLPALRSLGAADLAQIRQRLEDRYRLLQEETYANQQASQWGDILSYMRALAGVKGNATVPPGEAPAYFEWALWRAFLAINSLANKPWEARRFNIDQDFLPVGTAPGNGPDMIFEFEGFVLVVEVTLTSSSRQEAAEGEPVRRHVANIVEQYRASGKRVYGLFIANAINSNTAETFRIGTWYRHDDSRLGLSIVPLTLMQFATIFEVGFIRGSLTPEMIERIVHDCRLVSNNDAPQWKELIGQEVARAVVRLRGSAA